MRTVQESLDSISKNMFNISMSEAKDKGICLRCGELAVREDFVDDIIYERTALDYNCFRDMMTSGVQNLDTSVITGPVQWRLL